jgi:hypothetical protein
VVERSSSIFYILYISMFYILIFYMSEGQLSTHMYLVVCGRVATVLEPRVARFFLVHDTKTGKMYQIKTKCTKWS